MDIIKTTGSDIRFCSDVFYKRGHDKDVQRKEWHNDNKWDAAVYILIL